MAVCAWISIPFGYIAFTLQTFAVSLALFTLGGKWGTASVCVYLLLGAVGLPVFSGFQGGFGTLLGVTGGYLWGFVATGLIYWGFEKLCKPLGAILGLLACYVLGIVWFCLYSGGGSFVAAVASCVAPYVIPDVGKIYLAWICGKRIRDSLARNG
jgi:biotin transport system substrate-specific component